MILAGIRLRSALLDLWVLMEPCVESDFPSAACGGIFSQTVELLLKYTPAEVSLSDFESFFMTF